MIYLILPLSSLCLQYSTREEKDHRFEAFKSKIDYNDEMNAVARVDSGSGAFHINNYEDIYFWEFTRGGSFSRSMLESWHGPNPIAINLTLSIKRYMNL